MCRHFSAPTCGSFGAATAAAAGGQHCHSALVYLYVLPCSNIDLQMQGGRIILQQQLQTAAAAAAAAADFARTTVNLLDGPLLSSQRMLSCACV